MATTEHLILSASAALPATATPPPADVPPPPGFTAAWTGDDDPVAAAGVPGATSSELLTLGPLWPFIVLLAVISLIVPFLAGLVLVGAVGGLLLPAYLLRRHRRRGR
jgi:hypothetical protein